MLIKSKMIKQTIVQQVLSYLSKELEISQVAANNAHLAAIDDQSIAETQYDTVAIEAGYLAEGQSRRVAEIKGAITLFEQLAKRKVLSSTKVILGSLVQLEQGINNNEWFFIAPAAGGFKCEIDKYVKSPKITVTVITPQSPMGQALLNKEIDDEVMLNLKGKTKAESIDYIYAIT